MKVDAEAAEIGRTKRSVGNAVIAVRPPCVRRKRRLDGVGDFLAAERAAALRDERRDGAVDPQRRRRAGDEQQIAGAALDHLLEPAAKARGRLVAFHRPRVARRVGVQLADERVEIIGLAHRSDYAPSA